MIKNYKEGDILSESSHFIVVSTSNPYSTRLLHQESGEEVSIMPNYIKSHLCSGDEYLETVKVTKEDKKDGTPGIRTIFEDIHNSEVFTVCFKKQDKAKTKKRLNEEITGLSQALADEIDKVKAQKKGVADAAKKFIEEIVKNPILPYEEGEDRILRGYKVQFTSRDGRYNCVDMDIEDKENNIRPVNINTIQWLIYKGVKYEVQ